MAGRRTKRFADQPAVDWSPPAEDLRARCQAVAEESRRRRTYAAPSTAIVDANNAQPIASPVIRPDSIADVTATSGLLLGSASPGPDRARGGATTRSGGTRRTRESAWPSGPDPSRAARVRAGTFCGGPAPVARSPARPGIVSQYSSIAAVPGGATQDCAAADPEPATATRAASATTRDKRGITRTIRTSKAGTDVRRSGVSDGH